MASQIDNRVVPGSLLKQHKRKRQSTRARDESYLALIRQLPCIACGQDPAGEAAHVRISSAAHGKPSTGMAQKPDDIWTLPLCRACHMNQHSVGELSFWYALGINPVLICTQLQQASPVLSSMRNVILGSR